MENGVQDTGPPPPSPLTGCYLLIVVGEPHTQEHKDIILQRIAKGLLSWDITDCLIDIEKELAIITEQALEGEEARYGERLIQYASENLVTEILIHPAVSTLAQCIRNLLSSFTRHRHIIHAGYTYAANGSWILQDGTFSCVDFSEAFQEIEVQRVIRAYENSISLDIHCSPEGDWSRLPKEAFAKYCKVRLNPVDVLNPGSPPLTNFLNYISPYLVPAELETILECSDVVGNIRFSHPTLYIFPGGQGDAALFGINGFNMLLDGGFSRKACFWDFVRHLDRLDAVLMTRLNNGNVNGLSAVVKRKMQSALYPQIGHFFCNFQERKSLLSPDGDKDKDPLLINLLDEGQNMMANLKKLNLTPQSCYRDSEPINLYHKVGHGTLDMYVLSPAKDSKEVREFLYKWNNNDAKLFTSSQKTKDFQFPLQNLTSICCLLVWQPANPNDNITRILYPGSTPQHKVFEGLDKLKNLEYIKHPVCSENKLASSIIGMKSKVKDNSLEKIIADQKKKPPKPVEKKIENKDVEVTTNGVENGDKTVKKSDSTDSEKSLKEKKKPIKKEEKPKPKPKIEAKPEKKKPIQDKKPSPTTPKKTIAEPKLNGDTTKPKPKLSPSATPAKSAKEATNRKVIESKKQASKKEPPKQPEKPKEKTERKPISRRTKPPSPAGKATGSPIKKPNGVQKPDSIIKKAKLDKEGTTDSSTVSTPTADQKDITKLTPEEIEQLKAQELADLKEEQEVVKEIEAVFRKGEAGKDNDTELRKIKDVSIEDKTEPEEYLIIEKEEVLEEKPKEDETQKLTRDSEESEKVRKLSDEIKIPIKPTEEVQNQEGKKSEGISAASLEERLDISSEKKLQEGDLQEQNVALESQPDEKFSTTVESGATTAPTLPEDERITLDGIKEDEQIIEEKHVKEDTKEKEVPIIQLPPQSAESSPKIPPIAGIKLEKQTPMRDIVKTPDEVADLPMHEEADFGQYPMDVMKTSLKAEDMKLDAKKDEKQEKEEKSDEPKEVLDEVKDTKKKEIQKDEEPKLTKQELPKEENEDLLQTKPAEQQPSPAEDTSIATEIIKISELPTSKDTKVPIEDLLPTPPQDDLKIEEKPSEKIEETKKDVIEERKLSIIEEPVKITADQKEEIKEDGRKLSIASVEETPKEAKLLEKEEVKTNEETKSPSPIIGEKIEERKSSIAHDDEILREDQKPSSPTQELDRKLSIASQQEERQASVAKAEERRTPSPSKEPERKLSVSSTAAPAKEDKVEGGKASIITDEERRSPSPSKDAERKLSVSSVARSPTPSKDDKIEEKKQSIAKDEERKTPSPSKDTERKLSVSSIARSPTPTKDEKIEERKQSIAKDEERKTPSPSKDTERKLSVSSIARSPTPTKDEKIEERKQSIAKDEERTTPSPGKDTERKLSVSSIARTPTPSKDDKIEEKKQSIAKDEERKTPSPSKDTERKLSVSSITRIPTPSKDEKIEERKQSIAKDEERKTPSPSKDTERKLSVSSIARSPTPTKGEKIEERKQSIAKDEERKTPSPSKDTERKLSVSSIARSPTPSKDDKIEERKQSIAKDEERKTPSPSKDTERKLSVSSIARSPTPTKDEKIEERKQSIAKDEERKTPSPSKDAERILSVSSIARSPTPSKDDKIEERKQSIAKDEERKTPSPSKDTERKLSVSSVARSPTPTKDDKSQERKQSIAKEADTKTPSSSKDAERKLSVSSIVKSPTPPKEETIEERKQSIVGTDLEEQRISSPIKDVEEKLDLKVEEKPEMKEDEKQEKCGEKPQEKETNIEGEVAEKIDLAPKADTKSSTPPKEDKIEESEPSVIAKDIEEEIIPSPAKDTETKLAEDLKPEEKKDDKTEMIEDKAEEKENKATAEKIDVLNDLQADLKNLTQKPDSQIPAKEDLKEERKASIAGKDLEEQRIPSPSKDVKTTLAEELKFDDELDLKKDDKVEKIEDKAQEKDKKIEEDSVDEKLDMPEKKIDGIDLKDTLPKEDITNAIPPKEEITEERKQSIVGLETKLPGALKLDEKTEEKVDDTERKVDEEEKKVEEMSKKKLEGAVLKDTSSKLETTSPVPPKEEIDEQRIPSPIKDQETKLAEAPVKLDGELEEKKDDKQEKTEEKETEEEIIVSEKIEDKDTISKADITSAIQKEDTIEEGKSSIISNDLEEQRIPSPSKDIGTNLSEDLKPAKSEETKDEKPSTEDKEKEETEKDEKIDVSKEKFDASDFKDTVASKSHTPPKEEIAKERKPSITGLEDHDGKPEEKKDDKKIEDNKTSNEVDIKDVASKSGTPSPVPPKEEIIEVRKSSIMSNDLEDTTLPATLKADARSSTPPKDQIEDKRQSISLRSTEEVQEDRRSPSPIEDFERKLSTASKTELERTTPSPEPGRKLSVASKEETRSPTPTKPDQIHEKIPSIASKDGDTKLDVGSKSPIARSPTPSEDIHIKEDRKSSIHLIEEKSQISVTKEGTRSPTPTKEQKSSNEIEGTPLSPRTKEPTSPTQIKEGLDERKPSIQDGKISPVLIKEEKEERKVEDKLLEKEEIKTEVVEIKHVDVAHTDTEDNRTKEESKDLKEDVKETGDITKKSTEEAKDLKQEEALPKVELKETGDITKKSTEEAKDLKQEEALPKVELKETGDITKKSTEEAKDLKQEEALPKVELKETGDITKKSTEEAKDLKQEEALPKVELKETGDITKKSTAEAKDLKQEEALPKVEMKETGDITKKSTEGEDLKQEEALPKVELKDNGIELKMSEDKEDKVHPKEDTSKDVKPSSSASIPETNSEKGDAEKEVMDIPTGKDYPKRPSDVGLEDTKLADKESPLQNGSISDYSMEDNKQLEEITKARLTKEDQKTTLHIDQESRSASLTESPEMSSETLQTFRETEVIDKMEIGRKSPKEREEDVAIIVASVAEVLKSDAPLEEFEGKLPVVVAPFTEFTTFTTELRETHITTLDSPVTDHPKIDSNIIQETIPEQDEERRGSKASDLIKESKEFMETTSKIISDIKQAKPEEKLDDGELGTVHRMLVTASSEDGGEETEICPKGSITFSKSSESSGRSTPDLCGQKVKDCSGKSTPDIKITSDFEKADLEDNEKVFRDDDDDTKDNDLGKIDKPEPPKSGTSTPDLEKSTASKGKSPSPDSGLTETTKEAKSGSTSSLKEVTKPVVVSLPEPERKDPFDSGRSTPEFKDDKLMDTLEQPHAKTASDSGRSTPDTKSLDELKQASGKSTPDLKLDDKKKDAETVKDTIGVKEDDKSGKSTPSIISGRSSPDLKVDDLSKSSTPDLKADIGQAGLSLKDEITAMDTIAKEETLASKFEDIPQKVLSTRDEDEIPPSYDSCQSDRIEHKGEEKIEKTEEPMKDREDNFVQQESKSAQPALEITQKLGGKTVEEETKRPIPEVDRSKTPSPLPRTESSVESKSSPTPVPSKIEEKSPSPIPSKTIEALEKTSQSAAPGKEEIGTITTKEEAKIEAKSSVIVEGAMQGIKTDQKTEKVSSDIKETVKDFLAAETSTPYLSTAGPSKDEASSLSGKSTPDIAEVERFKDIQETLKYEKHIPGHSTPPTVPASPIVKDATIQDIKPTQIITIKEQEIRSSTPGSDSDFSSSQISRATNILEGEARESDDEDILGSPTSVTSQIGHSPQYDFEDEKKGQKQDPMSVSFYGSLPGDKPDKFLDDADLDFEKAMLEHRQARGEDLTSEGASYLHDLTRKVDAKAKEGSLMTSSFIGTELPTHHEDHHEDKEDPIASWGKPLGLPSPAPPDNKGTPKKEKKLPANVSAKNKLNDDRKRSESPSKYDKKKKYNPIYVDLTYVPHHGNANYSYVDFFKRVRARYYVFSGIEPSKEVYNGLLEAKQTWEDKDLEVTIIPTYDTDVLGYWVAENDELLTKFKIDLSPSASRCTINLQDHETSCSAYRLEF